MIIGVFTGIVGNVWSTLYFEYLIKANLSLKDQFLIMTAVLAFLIIVLLLSLYGFFRKMKAEK